MKGPIDNFVDARCSGPRARRAPRTGGSSLTERVILKPVSPAEARPPGKVILGDALSRELKWQFLAFSPMEWMRRHCGDELADNLGLNRQEVLPMVDPDLSQTMRCNP